MLEGSKDNNEPGNQRPARLQPTSIQGAIYNGDASGTQIPSLTAAFSLDGFPS
jgi:hypothetical protein